MSSSSAEPHGERPLANAGPVLLVVGIAVVAVIGLVLSLFRDPGLPAYVSESFMRVAGGLVTSTAVEADAARLSAALSAAAPGPVRVPALDALGYTLEGGTHVTLGSVPAALAIYHNTQQELLVWHAVTDSADTLPPTADVRTRDGRRFFVHYKGSTVVVFWRDGPRLAAVTASLPAEQVVPVAMAAARLAQP